MVLCCVVMLCFVSAALGEGLGEREDCGCVFVLAGVWLLVASFLLAVGCVVDGSGAVLLRVIFLGIMVLLVRFQE